MKSESEIDVLIGKGTKTTYKNLFPYLNVGSIPEVDKLVKENNFFEIPDLVSTTEYYSRLVRLKKKSKRKEMISAAADYINNMTEEPYGFVRYQSQFSESLLLIFNIPLNQDSSLRDFKEFFSKNNDIFSDIENQLQSIWLSTISLIIQIDYHLRWLEELLAFLVKVNALKHVYNSLKTGIDITPELLVIWWKASFLLPEEIFPLPDDWLLDEAIIDKNIKKSITDDKYKEDGYLYGGRYYALGTLNLIEYKLIGYELGELQKVENILKGETRESCSRELFRDQQQVSSNHIDNDTKDSQQQLIDKDLNTYVQQVLAERKVATAFDNYETTYTSTSPVAKITGGWTIDEKPAGGEGERHVEFVKKILAQTKSRASSEVSQARQKCLTIEKELIITNRFANESDRNTNGFYYWLNKKYKVIASDLKKRLLIEIIFPIQNTELEKMLEEQGLLSFSAPRTLKEVGLNSYADISNIVTDPLYYLTLAEQFSVEEAEAPPQERYSVSQVVKSDQIASSCSFSIAAGYCASSVSVVVTCETAQAFVVTIGSQFVPMNKKGTVFTSGLVFLTHTEELLTELSISVLAHLGDIEEKNDINYLVNIQMNLIAMDDFLNQWKYNIYKKLKIGYDQQLAKYHEKIKKLENWLEDHDTPVTRSLINNYIAKQSMRLLYDKAMLRCAEDLSYPHDELPFTQYFEYALEWDHLYCKLFELSPDEPEIDSLGVTTSPVLSKLNNNLYLKRFLLATKAKVLLPVKEDQVLRFLYFLDTGQIWHGAEHLTPVNQQALAIVNDYKKLPDPYQYREDKNSWTITLPTAMSVLNDNETLHNIGKHLYDK